MVDVVAANGSYDPDDLVRVAGLLDEASAEVSRHGRFMAARKLFLEPFLGDGAAGPRAVPASADSDFDEWGDEEDSAARRLPFLDGVAWAAMRYHVEFIVDGNKERVRLEPHLKGPDTKDPSDTDDQSKEVVAAWAALAGVVESPAARAVLSHLAFQGKAVAAQGHAQNAIDAYLQLAEVDGRAVDMVRSARVAVRLARAVNDTERHSIAVRVLGEVAERCMTGESRSVGGAREALASLVREKAPRARELVELACSSWPGDQVGQQFLNLKLKTATDDADREQIWRERVAAAIDVAERSDSNILKASRLRDVLALAEASGIPELREQAALLVQGIRNMDLEMMSIRASSHQFDELFEQAVASVLDDPDVGDFIKTYNPDVEPVDDGEGGTRLPTWYRRLRAFAQHAPPTGDPDQNRAHVENQYRLASLQHLFRSELQTPEGLPLYTPGTDAERFDLDMVRWETQLLEQWTVVYSEALHRLIDPEVPPFNELVRVLGEEDGPTNVSHQLAESFYRYWAGDGGGALHTTIPMLEALVRNAVIRADRGIYRLQKDQSPGQYVGLGVLLPLFYDSYTVPEKDQRFFNAVLKHPGGWNLRNLLSHGYLPGINGGVAAVALYAALRILFLTAEAPTNDATNDTTTDPGEH